MAEVPLAVQTGASYTRKAAIANVNDNTSWLPVSDGVSVSISGGSALTAEVYYSTEADRSDSVLVGTQNETERAANYSFQGSGSIMVKITALTAGPVTVRITGS